MHILEVLSRTEHTINKLRDLVISEPEFGRWEDCSGSFDFNTRLLQFFPLATGFHALTYHSVQSQASAIKIAKAFGGKWEKRYDGSWEGKCTLAGSPGQEFSVILHRVDPPRETNAINLD